MKICIISEHFSPSYGGQYTSVKGVIDICKLKKIKCTVIHSKSKLYFDKKKLIKTFLNSDFVHIFGGWTVFYIKLNLLAIKLKKKIIIHPMGFYEPWSLSQKRLKKMLAWNFYQKKLLLNADLIHCASKNEEENLKKLNKSFKTVILPFGISSKQIRKKISNKINKKCLFLSRLHKKKGLDILIKAWNEVDNNNWHLDIIGYGNEKYYKNLLFPKKNSVRFLKPISNTKKKLKILDNYDFLVLPSLNENFGIVILEALARGLPVLTTNETPWNNIQKNNAGWIINYSLIELKLVLFQIFHSKNSELIKKKRNALKVAKNFSKEKLSSNYYSAYRKLVN